MRRIGIQHHDVHLPSLALRYTVLATMFSNSISSSLADFRMPGLTTTTSHQWHRWPISTFSRAFRVFAQLWMCVNASLVSRLRCVYARASVRLCALLRASVRVRARAYPCEYGRVRTCARVGVFVCVCECARAPPNLPVWFFFFFLPRLRTRFSLDCPTTIRVRRTKKKLRQHDRATAPTNKRRLIVRTGQHGCLALPNTRRRRRRRLRHD